MRNNIGTMIAFLSLFASAFIGGYTYRDQQDSRLLKIHVFELICKTVDDIQIQTHAREVAISTCGKCHETNSYFFNPRILNRF